MSSSVIFTRNIAGIHISKDGPYPQELASLDEVPPLL